MGSINIPSGEITFHRLSERDTSGRVFQWQGQIYRGITVEKAPFYLDLFNRGIIPQLIAKKLIIETEITDLKLDDFELILQHRLIPFVSYPREWCDLMLKDATLLHLDLCWELAHKELITKDAYPLNILFDGVQPIFVDLCSIESAQGISSVWKEYEEFRNLFIHPLQLMSQNQGRIARWLLHDLEQGVLPEDVKALTSSLSLSDYFFQDIFKSWQSLARNYLPESIQHFANKVRYKTKSVLSTSANERINRVAFFERIRQEVIDLKLPSINPKYYTSDFNAERVRNSKYRAIESILSDLRPKSVLDIDSSNSKGFNSLLAASCGSQVVSFHTDDSSARQLYSEAKKQNLSILPLLMDFNSPSCGLSNEWYAPVNQRLKCELVLALDLFARLVLSNKLDLERIVSKLSSCSQRWLLVEFVPKEKIERVNFAWYQIDYFIEILKKHFSQVKIVSSTPDFQLLLCDKFTGAS